MESIANALARIDQLHERLGVEVGRSGFREILDARMGSDFSTVESAASSSVGAQFGAFFGRGGVIPVAPFTGGTVATTTELGRYMEVHSVEVRNGHLDHWDLVPVDGGWDAQARLLPPAAEAWTAMRHAAATDGIDLRVIDSYRSWDVQAHAHNEHLAGRKEANVLPPGESEHGHGLAVDITNGSIIDTSDAEWQWLNANAERFGWYPISNETWHWEFRGVPSA